MLITIPSVCPHQIIRLPVVKNTIIHNSTFSKLLYSDSTVTMDAIYLCTSTSTNYDDVEHSILDTYNSNKRRTLGIHKYFAKHTHKKIIKISGIWETETSIGLAFKLM